MHFCSKNALNIESLAQKRIEKFLEKGLISSACDIFYLKDKLELIYERLSNKNQLLTKQNASQSMQIKSIMKLLNEVERAKNIDFYRLIFGLGIRNVGLKAAKILSRYASNLSELRNLDFNLLKNQHDFGPVIIESLIDYFNNQKNSEQLNCLETVGFNFKTTFLTNQSNS
ncbi:DNA ligase [Salmonella enterica subsp. enterica serovar Typhimurium str. DT104]|nr:DNA ligase [Salmonella enterica subsp. enterica serovar Typhimurium str. DT104]